MAQEYYGRVCKVDLAGSERDESGPDKSVYMLGNSRGPRALGSGDDDPVDGQVGGMGGEVYWPLRCVGGGRGDENEVVTPTPTKAGGRRRGQ
jgi:hypothetical protein